MNPLIEKEKLRKQLTIIYDDKKEFRKGKDLRVLHTYNFIYDVFNPDKFDFQFDVAGSMDEIELLRKIYDFQPDIIVGMDNTIDIRKYFNHRHLLYIDENDYTDFISYLKYTRLEDNEVHSYCWREKRNLIETLIGKELSKSHIVYRDMAPSWNFVNAIDKIDNNPKAEVTIVSASNSSISAIQRYIEAVSYKWMINAESPSLKEVISDIINNMIHNFVEIMDKTGKMEWDVDTYRSFFCEEAEKRKIRLDDYDDKDLEYLGMVLRSYIGLTVYRQLIVKWIIDAGYKVELWGPTWEGEKELEPYYKGKNVIDRDELAHIYNNSKICIYTNPIAGMHQSVVEIISSKSFCIAYNDDEFTYSSLKRYFKGEESITFFNSRDELLDKIEYYLSHDDERKKIIENGNKVIKENNLYFEYQMSKEVHEAASISESNIFGIKS